MYRVKRFLFLIAFCCLFFACGKDGSYNESLLYGKWIKTDAPMDTLYFYRKDGKNLFSRNMSFNSQLPTTAINEYKLKNGKLYIVFTTTGGTTDEFLLDSFKWLQAGKKFEMHGNDRFPFLSSIQPVYTYTKLP